MLRAGIVAEGPAGVAVVRNILSARLGIERRNARAIRPELNEDESDRAARLHGKPTSESFSNWLHVLDECRTRTRIADFLDTASADERLVVIQIDTNESHLEGYDISRPAPADHAGLRAMVVDKINGLLGAALAVRVRHAVAIEETDAWLLTIYDQQSSRDTGDKRNPKERLEILLGERTPKGKEREKTPRHKRAAPRNATPYERADHLSQPFRDPTQLDACADRNRSLRLFVDSLTPPP